MPEQPDQRLVDRYIAAHHPEKLMKFPDGRTSEIPEVSPIQTEESYRISEEIAAVVKSSENPEELALEFAKAIMATLDKQYPPTKDSPYIHPYYGITFLCDMKDHGAIRNPITKNT